MLTQEIVREFLDYDSETGKLTWRERDRRWFKSARDCKIWNSRLAGKQAFTTLSRDGYFQGKIFDKSYQAHRIIFLYMTGNFPNEIDHINHIRSDNIWMNLRETTSQGNKKNTSQRKDNTTGQTGVYWSNYHQKWRAEIKINKKSIHLGYFDTFESAVTDRKVAELKYGFHENHGIQNFA